MSQLPILVAASLLEKSPANVRKSSDAEADARLEANIAERGILQNLVGVPIARKKGRYRISAGGRRLDAVQRLINAGTFPPDYQLPVLVLKNPGDAVEVSLAENFFRLAMNPAEACRAFRDVIEVEGKTPADVAKRFGVTERFVLGRLRLGNLAEPVFDALEANEITLDIAKAYASTADTLRQAAVFEAMQGTYGRDNPSEIRRQIATYSYRAGDPKALLVGREAYLAGGGLIDEDLFSDASSERWLDTHIVDDLAEKALLEAAEAIKAREGFAEVRTIAASHVPYMATWNLEHLSGETPALSDEQEKRKAQIEGELEEWQAAIESGEIELDENEDDPIVALEAELASLTEQTPEFDDSQKATALAYVIIGPDGLPKIHEQLYAVPVEAAQPDDDDNDSDSDAPVEVDGDYEQNSEPAVDDGKSGISQRLLERLAMMKTELLALHVASDPAFALDLATFKLVEHECTRSYHCVPSDLRGPEPARLIHDFESRTPAAAEWSKLVENLDRSWIEHGSLVASFEAFRALPDEARAAWLGWAVARTLRSVPYGERGAEFIDHLGMALSIDVAAWWRPTAEGFFDRITKPAILDLFEEIGGVDLRSRYAGSKKHDLAAAAERLFAGDVVIEADIKERALAWLPEAMRFDHSVVRPEDKDGEVHDAMMDAGAGAFDDGTTQTAELSCQLLTPIANDIADDNHGADKGDEPLADAA